ncbi:MAG TPA: NifU family protein [Solirubrobacteraceae bacterium]|nr:NifU family protein [Solirubrobacteraceae bacterium]
MGDFDELLQRLGLLLDGLEQLDEAAREPVFEFLDALEQLHRGALQRLGELIGEHDMERARDADPAVAWLLEAYGVGVDERAEVELALETVRPYIASHGGRLDVLDVADGVVSVRLAGSCSGCTASAVTLREGVEKALREGFPGFAALDVEEDKAEPHPPPAPTLLQIEDWSG